jgi:hypothetical protein
MKNELQNLIGCFTQGTAFDTSASVSPMITTEPKIDFEALGERWRVSSRTVRRWHARGVDVTDAFAVLEALTIELRRAKIQSIEAVLDEITISQNDQ